MKKDKIKITEVKSKNNSFSYRVCVYVTNYIDNNKKTVKVYYNKNNNELLVNCDDNVKISNDYELYNECRVHYHFLGKYILKKIYIYITKLYNGKEYVDVEYNDNLKQIKIKL